jgi:hypothetical protein
MAKANAAKFYEKLQNDAALAEKLNEMDKDFAEKNGTSADDAAMREKAAEAIILPLAQEVGLPFTLDELKEYEQEQLKGLNLSEDELEQVAGGVPKNTNSRNGVNACAYIGVGFGRTKKDGKVAFCILFGGSNGPVAG